MAMDRYCIRAGDSFLELARRFGISLSDLTSANPGVDPRRLRIGQPVHIPVPTHAAIVDTTGKYAYTDLMKDLACLGNTYPFLHIESIGQSVLGRLIPVVRIGTGPREIHYNGAFHANEWITSLLLMKFLEDYAFSYTSGTPLRGLNVTPFFEQTALYIVPMVNPDGVELVQRGVDPDNPNKDRLLEWNQGSADFTQWKANIRGVDLNDQFPAFWDTERERRAVAGPGPRDYTGESPLTEPEAKAMEMHIRRRNFHLVLALHTQGKEIYWNYRDMEPEGAEAAADRLAVASGYRAVKLTGSDAGYKDWFIQEFRRFGFTVEAGAGDNPLPVSQFDTIYEELLGLLIEGLQI